MNKFIKKIKLFYLTSLKQLTVKLKCAKNFKKFKSSKNNKIIFWATVEAVNLQSCNCRFIKNAGIRSINFNEANLITCLSNDYGHDLDERGIKMHCLKNDFAVFISSSGSQKILLMHLNGVKSKLLATFSGLKITILLKK